VSVLALLVEERIWAFRLGLRTTGMRSEVRPDHSNPEKPSHHRPEEAPAEQVSNDVPVGAAREAARRQARQLSRRAKERDRAWESAGGRPAHEGR
jgi:hypothetical protein